MLLHSKPKSPSAPNSKPFFFPEPSRQEGGLCEMCPSVAHWGGIRSWSLLLAEQVNPPVSVGSGQGECEQIWHPTVPWVRQTANGHGAPTQETFPLQAQPMGRQDKHGVPASQKARDCAGVPLPSSTSLKQPPRTQRVWCPLALEADLLV